MCIRDSPYHPLTKEWVSIGNRFYGGFSIANTETRASALFSVDFVASYEGDGFSHWVGRAVTGIGLARSPTATVQPPVLEIEVNKFADLNGDGCVNFDDFLILAINIGLAGSYEDGDLDGNGMIEYADFLLFSAALDLDC